MEELPSINPLLDAAEEYYQLHNVSRSLFCYKQALEWDVPDLRLWKGLANCHFVLGDFDKALQYWEKAAEMDEPDEEVESKLSLLRSPAFQSWLKRMSEAVKTVEIKDYPRARDLFKDLLEEKDGVVSLYQILGLSHMACADPDSARRVWSKGLQFDSSNPMLRKYLQSLHDIEKSREPEIEPEEEVKPTYRRFIAGSTAVVILGCLGFLLFSHWGIVSHKLLPQMAPANPPAYTAVPTEPEPGAVPAVVKLEAGAPSRGVVRDSGRTDLSGNGSTVGSRTDNRGEWQLYREGFTDYLRSDLHGARRAFTIVVGRSSGSYINRESLYYLARINYLIGEHNEAEACFQRYLEQFPRTDYYDESLYYLGCIYHKTGREEQARVMLRKLAAVQPNSGYLSSKNSREILRSTPG